MDEYVLFVGRLRELRLLTQADDLVLSTIEPDRRWCAAMLTAALGGYDTTASVQSLVALRVLRIIEPDDDPRFALFVVDPRTLRRCGFAAAAQLVEETAAVQCVQEYVMIRDSEARARMGLCPQ
jgi:hypothetical protein